MAIPGLSIMMFLTCADVVLRYFGYPIKGTFDVVGLLGAAVIALPIAYTQILRGHITIEFISSRYPRRVGRVVDSVNCLLNIVIYSLLVWQCSLYGNKLHNLGRVSETLQIPIYPFAYILAFGCAMMCLVLLVELTDIIIQPEGS
ncbi:MAG: TRAP transporter small permease [Deltaproteobacteria bacterium]|nr:TRAP transporter small permease [Deltaproteobacteria bacterium]